MNSNSTMNSPMNQQNPNLIISNSVSSANNFTQSTGNMYIQEGLVQSPSQQKANLQLRTGAGYNPTQGLIPSPQLNSNREGRGGQNMGVIPTRPGQLHPPGVNLDAYSIFKEPLETLTTVSDNSFYTTDRRRKKDKEGTDEDLDDEEMKLLQEEYEQAQKDIEELLKQKKTLEGVTSAGTAAQLKQVLRQMEATKRKVKTLAAEDEGDSDIENVDVDGLKGEVLGAFDKAQKKTAKKVIRYVDNKEKIQRIQVGVKEKKDAETMVLFENTYFYNFSLILRCLKN